MNNTSFLNVSILFENLPYKHELDTPIGNLAKRKRGMPALSENDLLRLEIERLKRIVSGNNGQSKQEDHETTYCSDFVPVEMILADHSSSNVVVTKESTLSQKIALFRSLFQCREDVYALRYEGKRGGKPGYTPACKNIWKFGVCLKPKARCQDCNHKNYLPIEGNNPMLSAAIATGLGYPNCRHIPVTPVLPT